MAKAKEEPYPRWALRFGNLLAIGPWSFSSRHVAQLPPRLCSKSCTAVGGCQPRDGIPSCPFSLRAFRQNVSSCQPRARFDRFDHKFDTGYAAMANDALLLRFARFQSFRAEKAKSKSVVDSSGFSPSEIMWHGSMRCDMQKFPTRIPTNNLTLPDVPEESAPWSIIGSFALTFDPAENDPYHLKDQDLTNRLPAAA